MRGVNDWCRGLSGCGHPTNWSCPCTCDEIEAERQAVAPQTSLHTGYTIQDLERYLYHDIGCYANDLDSLDHTACTCGLRKYYNPWNK